MANAADEKQVKNAAEEERRRAERDADDMRYILSTKSGRRFIWNLLGECGVFQCSFDGSSKPFFKEGERNVGLKILVRLNDADPQAYVTMINESRGGDYV